MLQADNDAGLFEANRPRLIRLAYRMLGSVAEAEDVVQDAWLRWQRSASEPIENASAFLTTIVTRLCIDAMKSARSRREVYVGNWLPDPILEVEDEPAGHDELTLTLMLALERLSPLERAAFLLHDVFGVPLSEVATALHRDGVSVRQLAVRARKHVQDARPRYPVNRDEGARIANAFFEAAQRGDVKALRELLSREVVLEADGGGKVLAFRNPIRGVERVLRLFAGLYRKFLADPPVRMAPAWIDGLPGYVSHERGGLLQTTAFAIEEGVITNIYITRNPEKLRQVAMRYAAITRDNYP